MDQGLPQNSVKDIIKDKYGFIWISTERGVLRYDGSHFLTYNNLKIKNFNFKEFLNYGNGDIICYNDNVKDCILIADRIVKVLPEEKVPKINLLIDNKLYRRFFKCKFTENFYPDVDYYFIQTGSEKYFFSNHKVEYQRKEGRREKVFTDFLLKNLRNTFEEKGTIYIADPQKRRTVMLKDGKVSYDNTPSLYNDPNTRIYWHQSNKQVFVINNGNIYLSKVINGKPTLQLLFQYKNIEETFLNCMFYDEKSNKMYFGDLVKGLNIVNLSNFYVSQKNIPFSGEFVYEALPFTSSSIISKQGFEYYKNKVNKIYSASFNYDKRYLLYDNAYNLLYIEFNKIQRRYRSSQYQKLDSISFPKKNAEGLFKTNQHFIVHMTDKYTNRYLYVFTNDHFKEVKNIFRFKENINFIKESDHDMLYVGTSKGIYLLSLSQNKIVKHLAKELPIKEIQQTKDGNFWFTTHNKGFYLIKNNEAVRMPSDKDGYINSAHHILEDHHRFFWISTNNGLFRVSKKKLLEYAENKNTNVPYYRYTKEDGLLNNEFNGSANPSGNILKNGDYVFPSMVGFVFFKPHEIKTHYLEKNQLFIERAKIGQEIIHFKDTLRLKSDYKTADIFLDFPYYHNIENLYIKAELENSDRNIYEEIKSDRVLTLNNIAPGNYLLHIRFLVSENGQFAYKKVFIEIKPFFYQTLLFKVLMILLVAIVIIGTIYTRTHYLITINRKLRNHLDNKDQELEITTTKLKNESQYQQKVIQSISHDLTTPIKFLASVSQRLRDTDDSTDQKQYFDGIYKTSEQLFKFTSALKEYNELYKEENTSDNEYSLFHLIEDKKLLFEQIAIDNNTVINNLFDPDLKTRTNKNILSVIIHNLIDNAVKNTKDGEIRITSIVENNKIGIGISDTGKGMSKNQMQYYTEVFESKEDFTFKSYGLGLHMVIQLIKKIKAEISFDENSPKGTIVKIFLKN